MFQDMSLKKKLQGAFLISAIITAIVGCIGLLRITEINAIFKEVAADDVDFLIGSFELEVLALEHRRYEKDFFINIGNKEKQDGYLSKFKDVAEKTQEKIGSLTDSIPDDPSVSEKMRSAFAEAASFHKKYTDGFLELTKNVQADETITTQTANTMMASLKNDIYTYESNVQAISELSHKYIESIAEREIKKGQQSRHLIFVLVVSGIVISILFGLFISGLIVRQIKEAVGFAEAMAKGDFSKKLPEGGKDEIGTLLTALGTMSVRLKTVITDIIGYVNKLNSASVGLSTISTQLSNGAKETANQSMAVAASAEQVSSNIKSVAAASEQATTNVNMVATASEEMTATISEISKNTDTARIITADAVEKAKTASIQVDQLGQAAQQISNVVETITEISEQVNLLALNATIEAARAGEAGKGFAVVANEIKELARQTATAAISIREQIGNVQASSKTTVTGISSIANVVGRVNDIVAGIAAAIEEQSAVTTEIVGNVAQAALGIKEVSTNITHSSTAVTDITREIGRVNQRAEDMAASSVQVNSSALELSQVSEKIKQLVSMFRV